MDDYLHRGLLRLARRLDMTQDEYAFGLEGIVVGETAVSSWQDGPQYRGYRLEELVRGASFLEVTYLLLFGELPDHEQFADFESIVHESMEVDPAIGCVLESLPLHLCGMQTLRTMSCLIGNLDQHGQEAEQHLLQNKAARIMAQLPALSAMRHRFRKNLDPQAPHPGLSFAANLLYMLTGREPSADHERALDALLIVNAEHGFNTSTFAARVVASSGMDLYGAVLAAMGTLDASWQDSPSSAIADVLDEIQTVSDIEAWIRRRIGEGQLLPGFRLLDKRDCESRARLLRDASGELARDCEASDFEHKVLTVERALQQHWNAAPHCGWYTQRIIRYLGLEPELALDLFAVGRLAGWMAHCVEQSCNNYRYDPRACYVGPRLRPFVPLHDR